MQTLVDLVNTDPAFGDSEDLPDVEALQRFVSRHQISHADPVTPRDVAAVQRIRPALGALFGVGDQVTAAGLVNELLSPAKVRPRLTHHDEYDWHIHYFAPGATLAEHIVADGGMALAHVIAADEVDRLRICEAPTCRAVLLDLSRNRSKRYCDASTCGNRLHVAAYRERKRSQQLAGRA